PDAAMVRRLLFLALFVLPFTLVALPLQALIVALKLPFWSVLPLVFFKLSAIGLGLRVTMKGTPISGTPALLVANHIGWLDIVAVASKLPASFVAKSEVARWPVVGLFARLHRT